MELEKLITLPAPPDKVWALLLDPEVMGACVPGMQAIEVLGPTEYRAVMQVKMAFISAKFKIRTTVVEQRPPHYLKSEGVGDDASVASSFKQTSEIFLDDDGSGGTRLRLLLEAELIGRLGSFGLSAMKTKADRLWDEFGVNLSQRLAPAPAEPVAVPAAPEPSAPQPLPAGAPAATPAVPSAVAARPASALAPAAPSWWRRWFGPRDAIHVVVQRGDLRIELTWPAQHSAECMAWLREVSLDRPS